MSLDIADKQIIDKQRSRLKHGFSSLLAGGGGRDASGVHERSFQSRSSGMRIGPFIATTLLETYVRGMCFTMRPTFSAGRCFARASLSLSTPGVGLCVYKFTVSCIRLIRRRSQSSIARSRAAASLKHNATPVFPVTLTPRFYTRRV